MTTQAVFCYYTYRIQIILLLYTAAMDTVKCYMWLYCLLKYEFVTKANIPTGINLT